LVLTPLAVAEPSLAVKGQWLLFPERERIGLKAQLIILTQLRAVLCHLMQVHMQCLLLLGLQPHLDLLRRLHAVAAFGLGDQHCLGRKGPQVWYGRSHHRCCPAAAFSPSQSQRRDFMLK
jgi:hypothetical protein